MAARKITLANLQGGETAAQFDRALVKLCENIADPNIRTDAKRTIKLTVTVEPDTKGEKAEIQCKIETKFPGPDASKTTAYIAMAPGTTSISLFGMDVRQQDLFDPPKEPTVTEIKPVAAQQPQQPKVAEMPAPAYAPPMKAN